MKIADAIAHLRAQAASLAPDDEEHAWAVQFAAQELLKAAEHIEAQVAADEKRLQESEQLTNDAYFYGVQPKTSAGHYLFRPNWKDARFGDISTPWPSRGGPFCEGVTLLRPGRDYRHDPRPLSETEPEGRPRLFHNDGWTAMVMWDRSADHRGACSAAFAFHAPDLTVPQCVHLARCLFPGIIERIEQHLGRSLGGTS